VFRVRCPACGEIVYESEEDRPLRLVLRALGYSCPRCGARLSPSEARARVIPA